MDKRLSAIIVSMLSLAVLGGCAGTATPSAGGSADTARDSQNNARDLQTNVFRDVAVADAGKMISDNSSLMIIDVRTPEEYSAGHLAKAVNIDVNGADFNQKISALDKNAPYLVYCRSGKRSQNAVNIMKEMGFSNVNNMLGGITQWLADGGASCTNC